MDQMEREKLLEMYRDYLRALDVSESELSEFVFRGGTYNDYSDHYSPRSLYDHRKPTENE